jgi:hypothetical protein
MRAQILQKVEGTEDEYDVTWYFYCYPGIQMRFEDLKIDIELAEDLDINDYQLMIGGGWDDYFVFETLNGANSHQFPVDFSDLGEDEYEGTFLISLPITFPAGQYARRFRLIDKYEGGMPIFGHGIFGQEIFAYLNHSILNTTGFPVIRADYKQGINVPTDASFASDEEKIAVISVLVDWESDTDTLLQAAIDAIALLDDNSTSAELYDAYSLAYAAYSTVQPITLTNALQSVRNEALQ